MNFSVIAVFNRCATLESADGIGLTAGQAFEVSLNGESLGRENRTVFTLTGLVPGTEYAVSLTRGSERCLLRFTTLPESVLLDVTAFGAKGDGETDCTPYLQAAVSSCPAGGTVYVPGGVYRTGPLFLKSDLSLWLDKDAVLLAETDRTRYPVLPGMTETTDERDEYNLGTWEGNPLDCFAALLTGIGLENVDIYGEGVVDGNAANGDWWTDVRVKRIAWRPFLLFFNRCRNVRVQGVRLQNACCWTVHPYYSSHVTIADVTIRNHEDSPNSDGVDADACDDVQIVGCDFSAGDDCVAIKSGKYYMSRYHPKETVGVSVRHCLMRRGHGAVVIGSETACGVKDVRVSRCRFLNTDRGLRIKTRRGRGGMSVIDEILMEDVEMEGVIVPFTANMFYCCDADGHSPEVQSREKRPVDPRETPRIGRIVIRRVRCRDAQVAGGYFFGLPEMPMDEIALEDVYIRFASDAAPGIPLMMDGLAPTARLGLSVHHARLVRLRGLVIENAAYPEPMLTDVQRLETEETP